ncbi:MAG TPA: tetratricopeptide repeat protein [Gemmatimonadales bacterium]|nr:tetratricopeptide repeat protein [Gemmatimonadales bacterium]
MKCRFIVVIAVLALAGVMPLEAQVAEGNAHWEAGRIAEAKAAYERELMTNPASVRSLFRLATLAAREGHLDSAMVLIARARQAEPADPDVRLLEAQVLSWKGDLAGAEARYDSVIADHPERMDAAAGRAQVLAWDGRLDPAIAQYQQILQRDSSNVQARVGLAQAWYWKGRPSLAEPQVRRALELDSEHGVAAALARDVARARRRTLQLELGWSDDSDDNTSWWQGATVEVPVADGIRVAGRGRLQQSSDALLSGDALLAEAGLRVTRPSWGAAVAAGLRGLRPEGGDSRTEPGWELGGYLSPVRQFTLSGSWRHTAFDETARLIASDIDYDILNGSLDIGLSRSAKLGLGGGYTWFSDDNRRYHAVAVVSQSIAREFTVGAFGRQMGFDFVAPEYFSPGRFRMLEARAGWSRVRPTWEASVSGGLGGQQPFADADWQAEWHAEVNAAVRPAERLKLGAFGAVTNSVERSVTGAYRYRTAGVRLEIGL